MVRPGWHERGGVGVVSIGYRVWAEVYSAAGERLAYIENIESASVTRVLDGVGSVKLSMPGMDEKALTYLTYEARVRVYVHQNGATREVGRGIVRRPLTTDTPGGTTFVVDCPDELTEFKDTSVLLGRSYGDPSPVTVQSVVNSLVGLVDGWTASVETSVSDNLCSLRVDGVTVLKALQELANIYGLHLRQSVGSKTLEFGAFGTDSGLIIRNTTHGSIRLQDNDELALIENLQITGSSEHVVNRIYPVGAGQGLAAINLENSTRSSPYAIQSVTGPDGRTLRYIETGAVPVREEVRRYKITPISNSAAAKEVADDALYDAAAVDLARSSVPQDTYRVVATKVRSTVRPGDVLKLQFKAVVEQASGTYVYRDVDDSFTVLEVNEDFTAGGVKTSLVISNVDRMMMDIEEQVIQTINDVKTGQFEVKTFPYVFNDSWTDTIMASDGFGNFKTARFTLPIPDVVTNITKVLMRIRTLPMDSGSALRGEIGFGSHNFFSALYYAANGGYYPHQMTLEINGVDVTSALSGPWGTYTNATDVEVDITSYINNASGGLYQDHTIELDCVDQGVAVDVRVYQFGNVIPSPITSTASRGRVQISIMVLGNAQSILTS